VPKVDKFQQELEEEKDLVSRLVVSEKALNRILKKEDDPGLQMVGKDLLILIRAYRRLHGEVDDMRSYLEGTKEFLQESYDEDDDYFDPRMVGSGYVSSGRHWSLDLIEEIDSMLDPDTIYMALSPTR